MSNLTIMYTVLSDQFVELNDTCTAILAENSELRTRNNELREQLAKYKYDTWHLKIEIANIKRQELSHAKS